MCAVLVMGLWQIQYLKRYFQVTGPYPSSARVWAVPELPRVSCLLPPHAALFPFPVHTAVAPPPLLPPHPLSRILSVGSSQSDPLSWILSVGSSQLDPLSQDPLSALSSHAPTPLLIHQVKKLI